MQRGRRAGVTRKMPKIYSNVQKPKKSYAFLWSWIKGVFFICLLCTGGYFLLVSDLFRVKTVSVTGNTFVSTEEILAKVPKGNNLLFLDKSNIITDILKDPVVEDVAILKGLPDEIRINVKERKPAIWWQSGESNYLLDDMGVAYYQTTTSGVLDSVAKLSEKQMVQPLKVVDQKLMSIQLGKQAASISFIKFIIKAQVELKKYVIAEEIDHIEIADTTFQAEFFMKSGMRVVMTTLSDPAVQSRNLARLIAQKNVVAPMRVDLRINRWAFVQ